MATRLYTRALELSLLPAVVCILTGVSPDSLLHPSLLLYVHFYDIF